MAIEKISVKIRSNAKDIEKEIEKLEKRIQTLDKKKVTIHVDMAGAEDARNTLMQLQNEMNALNGKKAQLKIELSDIQQAEMAISNLQSQLLAVGSANVTVHVSPAIGDPAASTAAQGTNIAMRNQEIAKIDDQKVSETSNAFSNITGAFSKIAQGAKDIDTVVGVAQKLAGTLNSSATPTTDGKAKEKSGGALAKTSGLDGGIQTLTSISDLISKAAGALQDLNEKVPSDLLGLVPKFAVMGIVLGAMTGVAYAVSKATEKISSQMSAGILIIAGISGDLMLAAEAMKQINEKVPDDLGSMGSKLGAMAIALVGMGALVAAAGALALAGSGPGAAVAVTGLALIAGISADLILAAQAIKDINDKVPEELGNIPQKIENLAEVMRQVVNTKIGNVFSVFSNLLKGANIKVITETIEHLATAANELKEIENIELNNKKAVENVKALQGIVDLLAQDGDFFENLKGMFTNMAGNAADAQSLGMIDTMLELAKKLKKLESMDEIPDVSEQIAQLKKVLASLSQDGNIFEDIAQLYQNMMGNAADATSAGSLDILVAAAENLKALEKCNFHFGTVEQKIKDLKDIMQSLSSNSDIWESLKSFVKGGLDMGEIATAAKAIENFATIATAFEAIEEAKFDKGKALLFIGEVKNVLDELSKMEISDTMPDNETAALVMQNFGIMATAFGQIAQSGFAKGAAITFIEEIQEVMQKLSEIAAPEDLPDAEKIEEVKTLVEALRNMNDNLASMMENTFELGTITQIISDIKAVIAALSTFAEAQNVEQTTAMMESIASLINIFKDLVLELNSIKSEFETVGTGYADAIVTGFKAAAPDESILANIQSIIEALNQKALTFTTIGTNFGKNLSVAFGVAVSGIVSNVSAIVSSVQRQLNSLYVPTFSFGGAVGTQYRAGGGILGSIFKPKGTDTVPAMLTPGEFVQRRKAVSYFGLDFMDRVNNLDLNGALGAITSRFGIGVQPPVSSVIHNIQNTSHSDNHARVTQNIRTGNPSYSLKRANRYLKARA